MYEHDTHSVEETSLFLGRTDNEILGSRGGQAHSRKCTEYCFTTLWLSNAALLCTCVLLSFHILWASPSGRASNCQSQIADTYSPANDAIEYEYRQIFNDSRFLGPPRPEWDALMESIMSGTLIRISEDELMMHGSDSIPLKDGGYAAGLGVAHSLHCVRRISSYPDTRRSVQTPEFVPSFV
ncbi:hypothetical protein J7T55_001722 [Diaporthe amygdali]|uniref:uncharacterized protein n=1 Tax=Phomopsis amygdali TaxID=1214568 RepID=UPI0022FDEEDD|nr:uncharacterized protein J7T55_001722 [Diaporthe amygdali]KAJ0104235.1 hypothetical protein J7T55_001722 [Diaporthe amygdali]